MNYIVFDMEWNQPSSRSKLITDPVKLHGEIIQIGAVKLDESFRVTEDIEFTVAPKYYTEMNHYVRELTGIRTRDLTKGKPFPEVFNEFMTWCGEDFRFITWGPDDMTVLRDNMILHGLDASSLPFCYNLQLIFNKQISGENRQFSLASAMEMLMIPMTLACHDARNDAIFTSLIAGKLDMAKGIAEYVAPTPKPKKELRPRYHSLRPHLILSKEEKSDKKELLFCPTCNTSLKINRRLRMRNRDKIFSVQCEEHGQFIIILQRLKSKDGEVIYNESIYSFNEETERFFNKMKLKCAGASKRSGGKAPQS